jgi:hypothetical protein
VAGDLNCAHHEIDIHNPKTNLKSAGFTPVRAPRWGPPTRARAASKRARQARRAGDARA